MAQNILVLGGSGKWSAKVYLPVILGGDAGDVKLAAIADPIDPRKSPHTQSFTPQFDRHHTKWIPLSGNLPDDLAQLDHFINLLEIHILAIVVPPCLNFYYLDWGISQGLDIICDKPPIALPHQFGTPTAAHQLWQNFNDLCDRANRSSHRFYPRPCQIYMHLRRRSEDPYIKIYQGLQEVHNLTKQGLTYLQIHLNNGCYRFSDEYHLPGAHGYTQGLGTLNHTGYHLIDFAAYCLVNAPPLATYIETKLISCTLVDHVDSLTTDVSYGKLLGRSEFRNSESSDNSHPEQLQKKLWNPENATFEPSEISNGEVDINLVFAWKNGLNTQPNCEFQLSLHSRGCTRRTTPHYGQDCTHDEGRVSDTVVILQQGPLQSFHLLLSDDSDDNGDLRLVRRLNPKVAQLLNQPPRVVYDLVLPCGESTLFPQQLVRTCLEVFANKWPQEKLAPLSLQSQKSTLELYVLAVGSAFGKYTSWWENSQLCCSDPHKIGSMIK